MTIPPAWRNTFATNATKNAKSTDHQCGNCPATIPLRKTYCGPCYDERLMENIKKNRSKYKYPKR